MSARFVNIDRDTPMLLPPDMRDWLPDNHEVAILTDRAEQADRQSQYNFTDPESRIMKTHGGFDQCYNEQAAVETESMLYT
jgi:hypothetical protein